jgi:hypothetical protein
MTNPPKEQKRMKTPEPAKRYPNRQEEERIRMQQFQAEMRQFEARMLQMQEEMRQIRSQALRARNSTSSNNTGMGRGVEEDDKPVIKFNGGKTGKKRKSNKKHRSRKYNKK